MPKLTSYNIHSNFGENCVCMKPSQFFAAIPPHPPALKNPKQLSAYGTCALLMFFYDNTTFLN